MRIACKGNAGRLGLVFVVAVLLLCAFVGVPASVAQQVMVAKGYGKTLSSEPIKVKEKDYGESSQSEPMMVKNHGQSSYAKNKETNFYDESASANTDDDKDYGDSSYSKKSEKYYGEPASPGGNGPKKKDQWYSWFWPLGDKVKVKKLSDEYIPFRTEASDPLLGDRLPARPELAVEVGNGFLDTGKLDAGFEVPIIGAVWQPRLWAYAINRTAVQSYDNGAPNSVRETEIANRLDLFVNLQLTGTEKILLGLRSLDNNRPNEFTRYTFSGRNEGFNDELNLGLETLFFEGDLGSLFPFLDPAGLKAVDYGFTVGRQPVIFQEGILINDTIDAVGIIRNNIPVPGTSNFRVSAMFGWNRLDRNDDARNADQKMFSVFVAADTHLSTYNLDLIYIDDSGEADGFYVGASAIQRLPFLWNMSSAFRVNASFGLGEKTPAEVGGGSVVGDGVLLTAELSKLVPGSNDIVYFNSFLGIGNFTQAGREAIVGGPLANTGILFASPNLSTYLAEINPFIADTTIGGAIGYQAFFDNNRRNLILEIAGRKDLSGDGVDSLGFGFQLQQAVGRHVQLTFEGFYTLNEGHDDGAGARAEIQVVY